MPDDTFAGKRLAAIRDLAALYAWRDAYGAGLSEPPPSQDELDAAEDFLDRMIELAPPKPGPVQWVALTYFVMGAMFGVALLGLAIAWLVL